MPRVSIQIPVYNSGRFIGKALDSILAQTYQDYEIIVIDDGSVDDTAEIVSKYSEVKYLYQEHSGVSVARNKAIQMAEGEFVAFLDADDMWAPEKLEKQVSYLDAHPECSMIFTKVENFADGEIKEMSQRQEELLKTEIEYCLVSSLMRKELFTKYGLFVEEYGYGEDTEVLARLRARGIDMTKCLDEPLYLRRVHTTNTSLDHKKVSKDEYLSLLAGAFRKARKRS